jgi:SAM-dependent methyltransferase
MSQTTEQVLRHYQIEKELASRLRDAAAEERVSLYGRVYDELYRRVPDHPMLQAKEEQSRVRELTVRRKLRLLRHYLTPATSFMEIGAGDCLMSIRVAPHVAKVIAVEVSAVVSTLDVLPANLEVKIISTPSEIPSAHDSIQLAFSDQLAEHLHPDDFIDQCRNVLKALAPGGRYVIVTPNRLNGPHDVSRGFDHTAAGMHLKEYSFTELRALLLNIGFRRVVPKVGFKGVYLSFPSWLVMGIEALLERLPAALSQSLANTLVLQVVLAIRLVATK